MRAVAVFTEVLTSGGLQRVALQASAVLSEWARERGGGLLILSMNDPVGEHRVEMAGEELVIRGFGGSRAWVAAAMLAAGARAHTLLLGHVAFASLCMPLRALRPGLRILTYAHGSEVWFRRPLGSRLGLRAADAILSVSDYTSGQLATLNGVSPDRIQLVPNALPPGVADDPPSARAGTAGRVLLSVSRLWAEEEGKGIDTVIRALPRILEGVPGAEYWIVGKGDGRPVLEALAREVGVERSVRFLGRLPDEELEACYRSADVFLLPSNQEGFGIVYLEAMQQGVPVIAGNHGGAPEVVLEGVTGFLVDHGDEAAIADRVLRLLGDPSLRARMGEAGRARVREHYTHRRFRQRLLEILTATPAVATLATASG